MVCFLQLTTKMNTMKHLLLGFSLLISLNTFSQDYETDFPLVTINDVKVEFIGIEPYSEKEDGLNFSDTAYLTLGVGESVEGLEFRIHHTDLRKLKVEQQYVNIITISDEGRSIDLPNWKRYTSDWIELETKGNRKYQTLTYPKLGERKFPEFTEDELFEYLNSTNLEEFAYLIKNPTYGPDSKPWFIGLSKIIIRISGLDKNNKQQHRIIVFEMPTGC